MTYHQTFDRLGNPVAKPAKPDWQHRVIRAKPAKPDWQHRVIRAAAVVTMVVSFGILVWGR